MRGIPTVIERDKVNYLVATGKPVGRLINFGEERVQVKRKLREPKEK